MRTNRPNKAAEPRHRKSGPARLGGPNNGGKRALEVDDEVDGPEAQVEEDESWQQTRSAR